MCVFWKDVWCGCNSFKEDFPVLFSLAENKEGLISTYFEGSHSSPLWNLGLRGPLNDWEMVFIDDMLQRLEGATIGPQES